jgi:hypothetical protein
MKGGHFTITCYVAMVEKVILPISFNRPQFISLRERVWRVQHATTLFAIFCCGIRTWRAAGHIITDLWTSVRKIKILRS